MKRALAVLFLAVVLISSSFAMAGASDGPELTVTATALNVRQGPGTNYSVIGILHAGDRVLATGQNSAAGWYQVQQSDGSTGWVSGLYVQSSDNLSVLPEIAAPAITAAPGGSTSTTSTTGGTIVFQVSSGGPIYAMNPDGTNLHQLTIGIDPAISPDGKTVAFTRWSASTDGASGSLWLINIDGSNEHQILGNVNQPKSPTWSSDGKQIAINMQQGGTTTDQRKCIPLGKGSFPPRDAYDIEISGGQLCFTVPANPYWGLRLVDASTGTFQDLPRDLHSFAPTWDPANAWRIVYSGDQGLMGLDITRQTTWPLTDNVDQRSPEFSPDGSKIAVAYHQNDHWEVHVLNADGTGDVRLTETPLTVLVDQELKGQSARQWNNAAPAWSPDGKQIVFLSDRNGSWDIWIMNADGSNQRLLLSSSALNGASIQYNGVDERVLSWR